jgi:hypothetical protein
MFQKITAPAAQPDDAVFHLIGGSVDLQNSRRPFEAGNSDSGSGDAGGFYNIAASGIGFFSHGTESIRAATAWEFPWACWRTKGDEDSEL